MESSLSRSSLLGSCLSTDMFTDMFMEAPVASLGEGAEDHSPVEGYRRNQRLVIPGTGGSQIAAPTRGVVGGCVFSAYGRVSLQPWQRQGGRSALRCTV